MEAHHPAHETSIHHIRSFHVVPIARFGKIELITSAHVVRSLSLAAICSLVVPWEVQHTAEVVCCAFRPCPKSCQGVCRIAMRQHFRQDQVSHRLLHMFIDLAGVNSKPVGLPAVNEVKPERPAPLSKCSNNAGYAVLQSE